MDIKDLVGKHTLDAVDFSTRSIVDDDCGDCGICKFRVDGIVYEAREDPDDGYRSCMEELIVCETSKMKNVFHTCNVTGIYDEQNESDHIIKFIDDKTGKIVLEVGTADIDDYYPGYIARYNPKAMAINANVLTKEKK